MTASQEMPLSNAIEPPPAWFDWAMAQGPVSGWVNVNGNRLHYLGWHLAEHHKPVLLLVHGFRAHAHWWRFVAPFFCDTHRVIAMDLSGMGDSGWRSHYSAQLLCDDINGLVEALAVGPVTAVAHSFGGVCLLRAAGQRPDLYTRLVVIDTFVVFEDMLIPHDPVRQTSRRVFADFAAARLRYRLTPAQPTPLPFLIEHVAQHSVCETEQRWHWKFDPKLSNEMVHQSDGGEMLSRVDTPVDYLYGECSALVDAAHAQRITDLLRRAGTPISVPGGHHHMMLDQPLALIDTLRGLL